MSPTALAVLAAGAVVLVGIVAIAVLASQRPRDGVDSFRRQIDALSPEARRGVVDQIQSVSVRPESADVPGADTAAAADDDTAGADDVAATDEADAVDEPDDGSEQRGA